MTHIDDMRRYLELSKESLMESDTGSEFEDDLEFDDFEEPDNNSVYYILRFSDNTSTEDALSIILNDYGIWCEQADSLHLRLVADNLSEIDWQGLPGFVCVLTEEQWQEETRSSPESFEDLISDLRDLVQKWTFLRGDSESEEYNEGYEMGLTSAASDLEDVLKKYDRE